MRDEVSGQPSLRIEIEFPIFRTVFDFQAHSLMGPEVGEHGIGFAVYVEVLGGFATDVNYIVDQATRAVTDLAADFPTTEALVSKHEDENEFSFARVG